jgi:hypothetical protein
VIHREYSSQLLDITLGLAFYAMLFVQHWGKHSVKEGSESMEKELVTEMQRQARIFQAMDRPIIHKGGQW